MEKISHKIVDSVREIAEKDWDSAFDVFPEDYRFYKTLEESKLDEFIFHYLILYHNNKIILIAPLFITDFNLDIAVEGPLEKIIHTIRRIFPRFMISKTLFCGSPFAENGVLGIINKAVNKGIFIDELIMAMGEFCKEKNIPLIIFKDFLKDDADLFDPLIEKGFFKVYSFPGVVTELNFNSFDEYLNSLGHSTRKSLRKKLKHAYSSADISVKIIEEADDLADDIHRLYENTYHSGSTKFERLTKEFFLSIGKNLHPYVRFFLYYVNGKLGAFNLCFVYKDLFIDKFIGFDYDISDKYNLYFLTWCFNIEWCIKNSIRFYHTGQTDYQPKLRLGGKLVPLYAYIKHKNSAINSLLKLLAKVLKPENFDKDIRDNRHV